LGLSITALHPKSGIMELVEPHASTNSERLDCLLEASKMGIRTYGMVCPCLPGILDDSDSLKTMAKLLNRCKAEEIFLEPVNRRGAALKNTAEALENAGEHDIADAVNQIRHQTEWSSYTRRLIETDESAFEKWLGRGRLNILLYPSGLQDKDRRALKRCKSVIWLGNGGKK
jgi:DNA repair photolyase